MISRGGDGNGDGGGDDDTHYAQSRLTPSAGQ